GTGLPFARNCRRALRVVTRPDRDRERLPNLRGERSRGDPSRSAPFDTTRLEPDDRRRIPRTCLAFERVDLPVGVQRAGDGNGLAAHLDCPQDLSVAEARGDLHREYSPVPARLEVRRLTLIGFARRDEVVRANRDLEHLF